MVSQAIAPSVPGFVNSLRGLVDDTASLTANGEPVALEPGGAFTMLIPQDTTEVRLLATGPAGTTGEAVVAVTDVPVPADVPGDGRAARAGGRLGQPGDPPADPRPRRRRPDQRRRARHQGRGG